MFIHEKIKNYYNGLSKNVKIAFTSTIIIGLICHIYMMTNKWVNLDDIVQLVDNMDRTTSGRWFLQFPAAISSEFSMPWLNGFLTIFYTAIMSCLVVSMFNINSKINTILISGILVTFPTLGSLMPFMNSQDAYQFGAMLAGLAAFLLVKYEKGFIFSSILLTLSLGIYQTYLGYAAGLIILYIIIELFTKKDNFKEMIILLCKTAISFIVALAMYLIISRGIFGHLLVDYKGLDTMGSLPINKIHTIIFSAYKGMFNFFIGKEFNYHFVFMPYLFVFAFLLTIYLFVYIAKTSKISKEKWGLLTFLILVFPIAINVIYIMSWQAGVMLRMLYGYTVVFILPLVLIDYVLKISDEFKISHKIPQLVYYAVAVLTLTSFLSVYNNIYVTNKTYFKVGLTNENSNAYGNRIISRIEAVDGYTEKTQIVFWGNPDSRTWFTEKIDTRDVEPFIIANHLTRLYSFIYYPVRFLGFQNPIKDYDEINEENKHLKDMMNALPNYPAKDSIQMINDTIYIKFKNLD
ncbi:glucosyltransferase domain-containing protein [Helcococcus bovis]|uniref:glucosyltransferase domain-containing protein n=1 Tax=Helcococcus bovis TaxID=3153252 RepID=UPI0038B8DF76